MVSPRLVQCSDIVDSGKELRQVVAATPSRVDTENHVTRGVANLFASDRSAGPQQCRRETVSNDGLGPVTCRVVDLQQPRRLHAFVASPQSIFKSLDRLRGTVGPTYSFVFQQVQTSLSPGLIVRHQEFGLRNERPVQSFARKVHGGVRYARCTMYAAFGVRGIVTTRSASQRGTPVDAVVATGTHTDALTSCVDPGSAAVLCL